MKQRIIKRSLTLLLVAFLLVTAFIVRFQGFLSVPPSLSWDEAAVGVNAWSIIHSGTDEWGNWFPLTFHSFGDDKNSIHVYFTAISIGFFGLTEFAVRLPALFFGILNPLLLYLVIAKLFKSRIAGVGAGLSLVFSPAGIIFSHFNHEFNFAIFFFLFGLWLFFLGLEKKVLLFFAFASFTIDLLSYNSAKVVVPILVCVLIALFIKSLLKSKLPFFIGCLIFFGFIILIMLSPQLSGSSRAGQNSYTNGEIKKTEYFKETNSVMLSRIYLVKDHYFAHFSNTYLFKSGDGNVRHSTQQFGEFYPFELLFMLFGLGYLIWKRDRESVILFVWLVVAPIPSALFKEAPHSARAMFMFGSMNSLVGLGLLSLKKLSEKILKKEMVGIPVMLVLILTGYYIFECMNFLQFYTTTYPQKYAIDWQYGMKQIVEYVKSRPDIERVYMTDSRSQPYIFFRFYEPISNDEFAKDFLLDDSEWSSSNTVERYGKYVFGRWDKLQSFPQSKVLYILTASEYSGLLYKTEFAVKKFIQLPDGGEAFYIVETKLDS